MVLHAGTELSGHGASFDLHGGKMKRGLRIVSLVMLGTFVFWGAAFAWQGRMAGMGDPYGLVEDESDFLVNPAKIADGQGTRYYGNYRFTYSNVIDSKLRFHETTMPDISSSTSAKGDEYRNEVLLGAGLPAGAGRIGVFFDYSGKRGDLAANTDHFSLNLTDMTSDSDRFALKALYGQAIRDDLKLGAQIQLAYKDENNHCSRRLSFYGDSWTGTNDFSGNSLQFMFPYDSQYWEALVSTGLEWNRGPVKTGLTIRGGSVLAGDNRWSNRSAYNNDFSTEFNIDGGVAGWNLGGDWWLRYSYSDTLSLPFLVRLDYRERSRSGAGLASGWSSIFDIPFFPGYFIIGTDAQDLAYDIEENFLRIEAGGGFDLAIRDTGRIAAGIYYNYIASNHNLTVHSNLLPLGTYSLAFNYTGFPDLSEHLVRLKVAGEVQTAPAWTLRGGLDIFGGFAREDYRSDMVIDTSLVNHTSMDGTHWGATASFGATTRYMGFVLEPFLQAGYQELSLNGGSDPVTIPFPIQWNAQKDRQEVIVSAGLSVLF